MPGMSEVFAFGLLARKLHGIHGSPCSTTMLVNSPAHRSRPRATPDTPQAAIDAVRS